MALRSAIRPRGSPSAHIKTPRLHSQGEVIRRGLGERGGHPSLCCKAARSQPRRPAPESSHNRDYALQNPDGSKRAQFHPPHLSGKKAGQETASQRHNDNWMIGEQTHHTTCETKGIASAIPGTGGSSTQPICRRCRRPIILSFLSPAT